MSDYIIKTFSSFCIFNYLDYQFKKYTTPEIAQAINCLNYSLILGTVSTLHYFNCINQNTFLNILPICVGGTLCDTLIILKQKKHYEMLLHHLILLTSYGINLSTNDINTHMFFSQLYLCEWSNIFLNTSYILLKKNLTNNNIFKYSNIGLIATYFPLRIVNFTYLQYKTYQSNKFLVFYLLGTPTVLLNYYWFYKLLKKGNII